MVPFWIGCDVGLRRVQLNKSNNNQHNIGSETGRGDNVKAVIGPGRGRGDSEAVEKLRGGKKYHYSMHCFESKQG